jgi:hypothetical protein
MYKDLKKFFLTGKTVRQKPHSRSFFDFINREVHKVTKVRRDDPKKHKDLIVLLRSLELSLKQRS